VSDNDRLSQIPTLWSVVRRAHADESIEAQRAQQQMIDRYGGAIQRYLLGAFRDQVAAEDAYQEFAVRFVQGDYHSVTPERGRFRSFLKTILFRLVVEHYRRQKRGGMAQMGSNIAEPEARAESADEELFLQMWSDGLLKSAWDALSRLERETGRPLFTVMRVRVEQADLSSKQLADAISVELKRTVTPANLRVMLHRARDEFARLVLDEVANTLDKPTRAGIEDELVELGLLEHCRSALDRIDLDSG